MEIEFALDKDDLLVLARYQADHSSKLHQRGQKLRWSYAIAFFLLALGNFMIFPDSFLPYGFGILAIISVIFYPVIHRWRVQKYIERTVRERATPASFSKRKLRVTPEGLEEESEFIEGKMKWSLVSGVDSTHTHTFIAVEGIYSVIIPKAGISSGDYDKFVEALYHHYQNSVNGED